MKGTSTAGQQSSAKMCGQSVNKCHEANSLVQSYTRKRHSSPPKDIESKIRTRDYATDFLRLATGNRPVIFDAKPCGPRQDGLAPSKCRPTSAPPSSLSPAHPYTPIAKTAGYLSSIDNNKWFSAGMNKVPCFPVRRFP
jgi:hypothetical protein